MSDVLGTLAEDYLVTFENDSWQILIRQIKIIHLVVHSSSNIVFNSLKNTLINSKILCLPVISYIIYLENLTKLK